MSLRIIDKSKFDFGLGPKFLFQHQRPYQQWVLGADFFLGHSGGVSFICGGGLRLSRNVEEASKLTDAVLANCSVYYKNMVFGFNYDLNSSTLINASNGFGALEFAMIYHFKRPGSKCLPPLIGCPDENTVHHIFY